MLTPDGLIRTTLREQVLASLHDNILTGVLPPGTKLGEVELSEHLGVSRGTVREALRHLQQAGLLEGTERNSLYVRTLTSRQVIELFQVRAALESMAATNILGRSGRAQIVDHLEVLCHSNNREMPFRDRLVADLAFHEELCRAGDNAVLVKAWTTVKDLMFIIAMPGKETDLEYLLMGTRHQPIIDVLRSDDVTHSRQVVEQHLMDTAYAWAELIKAHPAISA